VFLSLNMTRPFLEQPSARISWRQGRFLQAGLIAKCSGRNTGGDGAVKLGVSGKFPTLCASYDGDTKCSRQEHFSSSYPVGS
jgi:hypothetical protein